MHNVNIQVLTSTGTPGVQPIVFFNTVVYLSLTTILNTIDTSTQTKSCLKPVQNVHWPIHGAALLSTTLRDRLSNVDESDTETITVIHSMWRDWFTAVASLATSSVLQLDTLPPGRKQRVLALYGDLRRSAASLLGEMWFGLGEHKRSFIPCLVGPILEVSFLRDEEVRNTTIPLFFDMMQTEYSHSVASGESEGHLKDVESELIDKLDVLVESGLGDSWWRAKFVSLCGALCGAAAGGLRVSAAALVAAAARQLDTLLQYRLLPLMNALAGESQIKALICTVTITSFPVLDLTTSPFSSFLVRLPWDQAFSNKSQDGRLL
ncbi:hypothetical protein evm_013299 [Chilo suppressalis]|nr:hypothetical protein evm_013299 [Chilo suppressalis]